MAKIPEEFQKLLDALHQQADELRVKMHLAKADARDEWEKLEKQWEELQGKAGVIRETAEEASADIASALKSLAHEVEKGFERIRRLL